jgi:molecular chaperone IbpA
MRVYGFTPFSKWAIGFDYPPNEITITAQQNLLTVAGRRPECPDEELIYQGISSRSFERRFSPLIISRFEQAAFANGLLQIDLVRKVPEAMRSRRIEITEGQQQQEYQTEGHHEDGESLVLS